MDEQKERLKSAKMSQLDNLIKEAKKAAEEDQENEDPNEAEAELDRIEEALQGVGKSKVINMGDMESIDDKYQIANEKDLEGKQGEKRDEASVRRENFLNFYKEGENDDVEQEKEIDLSSGIKLSRDEDESGLGTLRTGKESTNGKPLI